MDFSIWVFIIFLLLGFASCFIVFLLKLLQKWLKLHDFYINVCYFCILLLAGLLFFVVHLRYYNGAIFGWNIFAFIIGYLMFKLFKNILLKLLNIKSATG